MRDSIATLPRGRRRQGSRARAGAITREHRRHADGARAVVTAIERVGGQDGHARSRRQGIPHRGPRRGCGRAPGDHPRLSADRLRSGQGPVAARARAQAFPDLTACPVRLISGASICPRSVEPVADWLAPSGGPATTPGPHSSAPARVPSPERGAIPPPGTHARDRATTPSGGARTAGRDRRALPPSGGAAGEGRAGAIGRPTAR